MEQTALESPIGVLILRFGRLWGPATFYQGPPEPPAIHIDDAGTRAARSSPPAQPGPMSSRRQRRQALDTEPRRRVRLWDVAAAVRELVGCQNSVRVARNQ